MIEVKSKPQPRPSGRGSGTALAASLLVVLAVGGCSKAKPRVPTNAAHGQVLLDGEPLAGALVVLHPQDTVASAKDGTPAPSPRALTDADGQFKLTTYDAGDGVPVGEYVVTVVHRPAQENNGNLEPGPNVLPERYASPATSDLRVRIAGGDNALAPLALKR